VNKFVTAIIENAVCFIMIIPGLVVKVEWVVSWPGPEYYN